PDHGQKRAPGGRLMRRKSLNFMSTQLTRKNLPAPRRLVRRNTMAFRRNTMAFPRELRGAIPDLHAGRVLELDSINGHSSNTDLFGPLVELKLIVKETGKLSGEFVVGMGLQADAARKLAATLTELADRAERSEAVEIPRIIFKPKK